MKKIILAALIISLGATANAQQPGHLQKGRMHHSKGMILQKLNLTEDQKTQFKSQQESFHKQMAELKKNDNITVREWKNKMQTLKKDQKEKMTGLLTTEQKAQLKNMKTEHKAMREIDAKARMEKMKLRLGLTDDQAARMQKSRAEMAGKMKALRENDKIDGEKKKEKMKELMKKQQEQMKSILTEEQLKKLQEGRKHGPGGMKHGPGTMQKNKPDLKD